MLTRKTLRFTFLTFIFSDSIHGQKLDDLTDAGPTQRDESLVQEHPESLELGLESSVSQSRPRAQPWRGPEVTLHDPQPLLPLHAWLPGGPGPHRHPHELGPRGVPLGAFLTRRRPHSRAQAAERI